MIATQQNENIVLEANTNQRLKVCHANNSFHNPTIVIEIRFPYHLQRFCSSKSPVTIYYIIENKTTLIGSVTPSIVPYPSNWKQIHLENGKIVNATMTMRGIT